MAPSKEYYIKFVHSNGTTPLETLLVAIWTILCPCVSTLLISLCQNCVSRKKSVIFLLEFVTIIVPIILCLTLYSHKSSEFIISSLVVTVSLIIILCMVCYNAKKVTPFTLDSPKRYYISNLRGALNLAVIGILAVDFKIFPRRFAKTETFGYSVMDAGVGTYIFINGIIAPEVRGLRDSIAKSMKSSLILVILGGTRFLITQKIDYNVPVSEYGVHWNFFLTLAVTKIFTSFLLNVIEIKYIFINALLLMFAHETLLQSGAQDFVLNTVERNNFITANKEGITSLLGYINLYLLIVYFGHKIWNINENPLKKTLKMIFSALVCLTLSYVISQYYPVSRKLANSAYCFWILFICIVMLTISYIYENLVRSVFEGKLVYSIYTPYIFDAINYNGLAFFLVANLVTGGINITLNTLEMDDSSALAVIIGYMLINCLVVVFLYERKIKLKF